MVMIEEITLKNRAKLRVERRELKGCIEVLFHLGSRENCLLHWGLSKRPRAAWRIPPAQVWPEGSKAYGRAAIQTPFTCRNNDCRLNIKLDSSMDFSNLVFSFFFPDTGRWDNNRGKNYNIELPVIKRESPLPSVFELEMKGRTVVFNETYPLDEEGTLAVAVIRDDNYEVVLLSDITESMVFHWGVALQSRYDWRLPPASVRPAGSTVYDKKAVQTPFILNDGINRLILRFSENEAPLGISLVLKVKEDNRWFKDRHKNFFIPVTFSEEEEYPGLSSLTEEIIHGEMGNHSWTLMHRFNLCHDLVDSVKRDQEGLAMLYVWMRFSEIRQLDWQRRYNTQPRELSHAQDRLTLKIAELYRNEPESRELLRLVISTLGRGGEGQRIRDEILNIMHRHHIKEVSGHFMEEWHQKLHNNTTPDDIVICEAYLEFLRSNGNLDLFYETLEMAGVTRQRLESFERPIVTPPDFVPHLKDALIHDFENYLRLLKSIHSGTDLEGAVNAAGYLIDGELGVLIAYIWQYKDTGGAGMKDYIERITGARRILRERLTIDGDSRRVRDMLFLDLALEGFMRIVIERSIHEKPEGDQLVELTGMVLENIRFSYDNDELSGSNREWYHLKGLPRFSKDWSLHAKAVLERVSRATGSYVDRFYQLFQLKAEHLGKAFKADSWTITLFAEEVVRGMSAFVLSMLIRHLDPLLRKHAKLGDWQVISPGRTAGWLEVAESLGTVGGRHYDRPSIIIAEKVKGDEEPPEGTTAIITPDPVDLVSHIAVRARNANLLFATCYDADCFDRLKSLKGHMLNLNVNVSGDVEFEQADEEALMVPSKEKIEYERRALPEFSAYAISSRDFNSSLVGGKSNNLKRLGNNLPDWIHLPVSAALPFGIFDKVLSMDINKDIAQRYNELISRIDEKQEETLDEIRRTVLDLNAPEDMKVSLHKIMDDSGLGWPEKWSDIWMCIKRVWSSKWNERAYLSRNAVGMHHEDILMAVLIQQVVEAEYAFVVHTANPFTQDRNELYAEIVPGLGETLVGNYPGRALSYVSKKNTPETEIISYPSKSTGLFGGGFIFRSDSNAEDLPGYAGAGLYDSVMLEPPREVTLDYTKDMLVWDEDFKKELLSSITKIGTLVEENFGFPQDIEGVYSKGRYYVVQTRPQVGIKD
jgi:alpha-glucan,water dikinase